MRKIVDAAFALSTGWAPELKVCAKSPKRPAPLPKIYRHFTDKSDLLEAIADASRDMLRAAISRRST